MQGIVDFLLEAGTVREVEVARVTCYDEVIELLLDGRATAYIVGYVHV